MLRQQLTRIGHGTAVWMQVALGCGQGPVAGDALEVMDGDAGVGHPGKSGVAQRVAA